MKYIATILFTIILCSCNLQQNEEKNRIQTPKGSVARKYPPIIDSLGFQALYDKTKWTLYCIYSDDTCLVKNNFPVTEGKTFGSLDLKFEELRQQNDTIEFSFCFYINDTLRYDITTMKNPKRLATGIGYRKGNDSILFYISETTMRYFWEKGLNSRYANPLQPEVIAYIRKNKESLNPWFKEEATRKGFLH